MSRPILLLHGALGAASQLADLQKLFEAEGKTVYTLSFSGHGGKAVAKAGFSIEIFAEDVLAFLHQHSIHITDIFGYSMGGYVALWLAHQHPEKIGKIYTLGTKFDWSVESAEKEIKKLNPEKIVEKVPAFAKTLEERHHPLDWKEMMRNTASLMRSLGSRPLLKAEVLSTMQTTTMIAVGDQDDMVERIYSEQVSQQLAHASFGLLPETPHMIERVNLTLLHKALKEFFN